MLQSRRMRGSRRPDLEKSTASSDSTHPGGGGVVSVISNGRAGGRRSERLERLC